MTLHEEVFIIIAIFQREKWLEASLSVARLEPKTLLSAFTRVALLSCVLPALHLRPGKVVG